MTREVHIHSRSLLLTSDGLLTGQELRRGLEIAGTRDGTVRWHAFDGPIERTTRTGLHLFTKQSDFVLADTSNVATPGGFLSCSELMRALNPYDPESSTSVEL